MTKSNASHGQKGLTKRSGWSGKKTEVQVRGGGGLVGIWELREGEECKDKLLWSFYNFFVEQRTQPQ